MTLQSSLEINRLLDTKIQEALTTFEQISRDKLHFIVGPPSGDHTENPPKKRKNSKSTEVSISDIALFYTDTPDEGEPIYDKRTQNGSRNDRRENVLLFIANRRELPEEYAQDPNWLHLHTELHKVLSNYYDASNQMEWNVQFVKRAGRMYNYDFEFTSGTTVVKYEFKYCTHSPRIDALPQIYQGACSTTNIFDDEFVSFDEYYYENGLSNYCKIDSPVDETTSNPSIDKPTYLKHVKNSNSTHPFFVDLKSRYSTNVDEKNVIVNDSIEEYLKQCQTHVNIDAVSNLLQKQKEKTYLMWHPKTRQFYTEQIPENELTITRVSHITKNTIVFVADTYSYCFLLRWKNGKGVLNPAWQISVRFP